LEFKDGAYFIVGANGTGKSAIFELTRRCLSKSVNTSHSCVTNKNDDAFVISKFEITEKLSDKLPAKCDLYSLYAKRSPHENKGEIYKVVCITDKEKTHCYLDCYNRFKATRTLTGNEKDVLKAMKGLLTSGTDTKKHTQHFKSINDMVLMTRGKTEEVLCDCEVVLEKLYDGNTEGALSDCEAVLQKLYDEDTVGTLSDCEAVLQKLYDKDTVGTLSDCEAVLQKLNDEDTIDALSDCKAVLQKLYDFYTGCKAVLQKLRDGDIKGARSGCKDVLEKLGDGNTEETFSDCKAVLKKLYDLDTKDAPSDCEAVLQTLNDAIAITFPIRSPGPIQWNHSENIGKGNEHYVTASKNAEILQRLIGSEDVNEEMSEDIFQTIINPLKYTFQKNRKGPNSIITVYDGKMRIPLLKVPEGIIEAKQFSLMFAHKKFQTLMLEEPDRSMHPQMIQKLRDLSIRRCQDQETVINQKTLILISHQPVMMNQWTMSRLYVCRKKRDARGNCKHWICNWGKDVENTHQHQDQLKQMLYSASVLFVEGITDKSVIGWVFDRILEFNFKHLKGFNEEELKKLKEIIAETQIISMEGWKGCKHMIQAADALQVPFVFLLDRDIAFQYQIKNIENVYKTFTSESTQAKEYVSLFKKSLELPSPVKTKKDVSTYFALPPHIRDSKDAKAIIDFLREKRNVFLWKSITLEAMMLNRFLDIRYPSSDKSTQTTSAPSTQTKSDQLTQTTSAPSTQVTSNKSTDTESDQLTPTTSDQSTPTTSDQSTPTTSDQSTPTTSDLSTPTTSDLSTPTTSDLSTPTTSEQSTPTTSDQSTPTTSDQSTPTTSDQSTPTTSDQSTPTTSDLSTPKTSDKSTPTTSDQSTLTTSDQSTLTTSDQSTPTTSDQSTPTTSDQSTPTTSDQSTPTTSDQSTPTTSDQSTPTTSDQSTPTTSDQSTPTTSDQSTQQRQINRLQQRQINRLQQRQINQL
ncbi:uncharacterized protein LOC117322739, partial [Pecten maximus]|uniref:uncharacterized protein LOC117322739 n=1 Tax=Pecten maximus TaxID=6579 RepID=UPI001457F9D8